MDASNPITATVFSSFLKCQTKAHLLAIGEFAADAFFGDIEASISSMYKAVAKQSLRVGAGVLLDFEDLRSNPGCKNTIYHVDCETVVYDFALPPRPPGRHHSRQSPQLDIFVPVLFSPWDKAELSDSLLLSFGALALSQITGALPETGTLIYGEGHRHKAVMIRDYVAQARQIIDTIGATWCGREPPPLS